MTLNLVNSGHSEKSIVVWLSIVNGTVFTAKSSTLNLKDYSMDSSEISHDHIFDNAYSDFFI